MYKRDNLYIGVVRRKDGVVGSILYEYVGINAHDIINETYLPIGKYDENMGIGVFNNICLSRVLNALKYDKELEYKDIIKIYKLFLLSHKLYLKHSMCYGNNTDVTKSLDKEEWDKLMIAFNERKYYNNIGKRKTLMIKKTGFKI